MSQTPALEIVTSPLEFGVGEGTHVEPTICESVSSQGFYFINTPASEQAPDSR